MAVEWRVDSLTGFIQKVLSDTADWKLPPGYSAWFRGQSDSNKRPLPGILRGDIHNAERNLIARFRSLAPMFGPVPHRDQKDEWLYLMQHVGLPTRLLDWTEGALIALYFAVQRTEQGCDPGVWMLHPLEMNCRNLGNGVLAYSGDDAFVHRCEYAYGEYKGGADIRWPIAINPTHIHPRMRSQKGFMLHGSNMSDFERMAEKSDLKRRGYFCKYIISADKAEAILSDLRLMGITHCALFADHDGLATELKRVFSREICEGVCPDPG